MQPCPHHAKQKRVRLHLGLCFKSDIFAGWVTNRLDWKSPYNNAKEQL